MEQLLTKTMSSLDERLSTQASLSKYSGAQLHKPIRYWNAFWSRSTPSSPKQSDRIYRRSPTEPSGS